MPFRQAGRCRLIVFVLTLCLLTGAGSAALCEAEMTEEQLNEASERAYEEAMLQTETEIAFTTVASLGQYLSGLMVYAYGEVSVPAAESANAAVQLVDEVICRAEACFRSGEAGADAEKLAGFDQAKEAWAAAAGRFGAEGERFEAGLSLMDERAFGPAADAFGRMPAEAQPEYLELAEAVYRAIWQTLRPAVADKAGEAFMITGLGKFAGSEEISSLEDAAAEFMAGVKDVLSFLSDGFSGERSEERARIEQAGSRLNALESEVKLVINTLGFDTAGLLPEAGEE